VPSLEGRSFYLHHVQLAQKVLPVEVSVEVLVEVLVEAQRVAYDQQFQMILHLFLVVLILMKVLLLAEVMLKYLLDAVLAQILLQKQSITLFTCCPQYGYTKLFPFCSLRSRESHELNADR
jgi:hypothetical protein